MRSTLLLLAILYLAGPAARAAEPTFARDGVAFLAKHCTSCHGAEKKKADLALHLYKDDAALLKDRKTWHKVLRVLQSAEMPPAGRKQPALAEVEAFASVVDAVFDQADRSAPRDPGRVTIRRLNRTEYNNTIRDLVGVDFSPAEDFPSDDVGHGFDNIGDVLSLSPVLLERYLSAAENIMHRAITPEPPKPPQRTLSSRYLEPATSQSGQWRTLTKDSLHSLYHVTQGGEFVFKVRAWGRPADGQKPRIVIKANGKDLQTHEVAAEEKAPHNYEAAFSHAAGEVRIHVTLLNPSTTTPPRAVIVEWFQLTGPTDTRPDTQRRLLACTPSKPQAEQSREVLTRFASRAYRRPPTRDEIDRLVKLVETAQSRGDKWEAGLQLAFQAVLVSPKFLFRVELDDRPDSPQPHPLTEWQLASRLSYFLWSSMPDEELFALAGKGELSKNLDAQVRRMLKDPKARALVDNFFMQWLQLRNLKNFTPDPKLFPNFNEQLRSAMFHETELFLEAVIKENRSILDLIDADFTFLNAPLARHYGIADTNGNWMGQKPAKPGGKSVNTPEFQRVSLQSRDRGGVFTQASVLAVTSNPTRTSPVKRGRFILDQVLGTSPPPPPPDVPELNDQRKLTGTLRQQMEQHRVNPTCASCHARMDPLGFAFENFDALGAFRSKDAGQPIDASGTLPSGQSFKGPAELKDILKAKKDLFSRCLAEKMLTYSLGRGVEYYDRRTIDGIRAALARDNYKFSTLVVEIVRSEPFRMRRGKDVSK